MNVRPYLPDLDYVTLLRWYELHNLPPVPREFMPETGFIVEGVAAGFLYLTDSKLGIIDLFISNPECSKEVRNHGLDLVVGEILREARLWGCKGVLATSAVSAIEARALKFGFSDVGTVKSFFLKL